MTTRLLMSGFILALTALDFANGRLLSGLDIASATVGCLLAVTVMVDRLSRSVPA